MNSKETAKNIIGFLGKLDDFWADLRETVLNKLAVIAKQSEELKSDAVESESKFIETIIEMIFIWKKTPGIFKPFFKIILTPILRFTLTKLETFWLEKIRLRISKVKITSNKVTFDNVV